MAGKTIVILGAGVGGLVAAHKLRQLLDMEHRVVLVDKSDLHVFAPSFLWLMLGWREPQHIARDLHPLGRKGIEFIHTPVEGIDIQERRIATGMGLLHYDYLVTALGAELAPETIPGLNEGSFSFYDLRGAQRLRDTLMGFSKGTVAIVVASMPFKCPPAPYEASLLLDYFFQRRGVRDGVDIHLYTPEPRPIPISAPEVGQSVAGLLGQRSVGYHPNHRLSSVDPEKKMAKFEDGQEATYDLLIAVPPHRAPQVVREAGLCDGQPWVAVDKFTLKTQFENVYAIGDVTVIPTASGLPLPKAGVFAHNQAEVVAQNIASQVLGREPHKTFKGRGFCFLELGYGKAAMASGDFYAEPAPAVKLRRPARLWHGAKVLFEKWWLRWWF